MKRLILDISENEIKAVLTENGRAAEIAREKQGEGSRIYDIFRAVVEKTQKNGFVFLDIGGERLYLNLGDKREDGFVKPKNGDSLVVQILKDARGGKRAYATRRLMFPGRLAVLEMCGAGETGRVFVSRKITGCARRRLALTGESILAGLPGYNLIIRTNADGRSADEIGAECAALADMAKRTESAAENIQKGLVMSISRSQTEKIAEELTGGFCDEIVVNDPIAFESLKRLYGGVSLYDGSVPVLERYGAADVFRKACEKQVWLPSGGRIVIETTEACHTIDVNSGKYSGKKNKEDAAFLINSEAAAESARQIRLRNLSGVIIIDFISMSDPARAAELTNLLNEAFLADRLPARAIGMTKLGLMEITRKRTRQTLSCTFVS